MENQSEKSIRGYVLAHKCYYSPKGENPEIHIGMYYDDKDGGTDGEMVISWSMIGRELAPKLSVFNDAWAILASWPDLIKLMGEKAEQITPDIFVDILNKCGFKDMTPYTDPNRSPEQGLTWGELYKHIGKMPPFKKEQTIMGLIPEKKDHFIMDLDKNEAGEIFIKLLKE